MATPDRTDELIRAMLERRSEAPASPWLADRTMHAVTTARQVKRGRRGRLVLPTGTGPRIALVAVLMLLLGAIVGGSFAAANLFDRPFEPKPTQPAVVVGPTGSPSPSVEPTATAATPSSPSATPRPMPTGLVADTMAVVTKEGGHDGLRVRSAPGVGSNSRKLVPLLRTGARMLVLSGPVNKDTYDWYEVLTQTDEQLYGWVASGKGGEAWVRPVAPRCPATLSEEAVAGLTPIEFFTCYGDAPVQVRATGIHRDVDTGSEPMPCPYTDGSTPCEASPPWLFEPLSVSLMSGDGQSVRVFAPPDLQQRLDEVPDLAFMTVTLAMDDAEAPDCKVVDRRGRDAMPRGEAVARCRLQFVITEAAWDQAMVLPHVDDLVRVLSADLPVYKHPGGEPTSVGLAAGDEMLIGEPERQEDGEPWVPVFPRSGVGWPVGWVPFLVDDRPTLEPIRVDCPEPGDWGGIVRLDLGARLACFADVEEMRITVRVEPAPADPNAGACGAYLAVVPSPRPCEASPGWLAGGPSAFGIDPNDEDARGDLRFDPLQVDASSVPTTPTVMRLSGRFGHPAGWDCEVRDPATGEALVWAPASQAYCRGQFVVTGLAPAP